MRSLIPGLLIINLLVLLISLSLLPDPVAVHFNLQGEADGWMSLAGHTALMAALILLMTGVFAVIPHTLRPGMERWLSIPQREQWLLPQNRARLKSHLERFSRQCGALTALFLLAIQGLLVLANNQAPAMLNSSLMVILLIAYSCLVLLSTVRFFLHLKHPNEE